MRTIYTLLFALMLSSCGGDGRWTLQQQIDMRKELSAYRDMVYLENLTNEDFILFADGVASNIECDYPSYTQFIKTPSVSDTVNVYIVGSIIDELLNDISNMRYLLPYGDLVTSNQLPAALSLNEQRRFYSCLAQSLNIYFSGLPNFVEGVVDGSVSVNELNSIIKECASELFNWSVVVIE